MQQALLRPPPVQLLLVSQAPSNGRQNMWQPYHRERLLLLQPVWRSVLPCSAYLPSAFVERVCGFPWSCSAWIPSWQAKHPRLRPARFEVPRRRNRFMKTAVVACGQGHLDACIAWSHDASHITVKHPMLSLTGVPRGVQIGCLFSPRQVAML